MGRKGGIVPGSKKLTQHLLPTRGFVFVHAINAARMPRQGLASKENRPMEAELRRGALA